MSNSMTAVDKIWIGEKLDFGDEIRRKGSAGGLEVCKLLPTTLEAAQGYARDAKGRRSRKYVQHCLSRLWDVDCAV
jgi:hypothetical protein